MTQVPAIQGSAAYQPTLSAVKIDISNPEVTMPSYAQNPIESREPAYTKSLYDYPQAQIYEMPSQSIYGDNSSVPVPPPVITPTKEAESAAAQANVPVPPAATPNVPAPTATETVSASSAITSSAAATTPITATAPIAATPSPVEIQPSDDKASQVDLNAFIQRLTSPDYSKQADALEAIADLTQKSPEQAKVFVDTKVIDILTGIMDKDTSKLEGPTADQYQIREKILNGKTVTDAEKTEANKVSPMEQAELNKQYAVYTTALLQGVYLSEINKESKTAVPFSELPGIETIEKEAKSNSNPAVKRASIEALSYIQRPEYKQDLTALFTEAQKDKNTNVQQAATKALNKLNGKTEEAKKA